MSDEEEGGDTSATQRVKAQRKEEKRKAKKMKAKEVVEEEEAEEKKPSKKRRAEVETAEESREAEDKEDAGDSYPSNRVRKTADGDEYIDLSAKRRLTVRVWQGGVMVDVREMYDKHGELHPGKKGIALNLQQWKALVDGVPDVEQMIQRAKR